MKWTYLFLLCSGVALAANQDNGDSQNNNNNNTTQVDQGQNVNNATDVQGAYNSTDVAGNNAHNSTANVDDDNNQSNSTNNDNENNNNNNNDSNNNTEDVGNLVDQFNGQNCINITALQNVDPSQVDLANINLGLLNLGSINLQDQLSVAQGILALMKNFCLGSNIDLNVLLSLGLDDQVEMFVELAQLAQLQSLGLMNVFGVQTLLQSNLLFGNQLNGLSIGTLFRRDTERVRPTSSPKRTVARRGLAAKRQCNLASVVSGQSLPLCPNVDANNGDVNNNNNNNDDDHQNDNNTVDDQEQNQDQQNEDQESVDQQDQDQQNQDEVQDAEGEQIDGN